MRVKSKTKEMARLGAGATAAVGLAIAFTPLAGAASAEPGLSVTPSSGLSDGETVSVSATGFVPESTLSVGQCASVDGAPACPAGEPLQLTTDADGAATTPLTVQKTFEGYRFDGTSVGMVDCTVDECFVGAGDSSGNQSPEIWLSFE